MPYSKAITRYNSIRDRAFKSYFDIFLIKYFLRDSSLKNVNISEFESFNYHDPAFENCLKIYQLSSGKDVLENDLEINDLDKAIDSWMTKQDTKPYKDYYVDNRLIDKEAFKVWYGEDEKDRQCLWCNITKKEINELIKAGQINTKRLSTRGRDMEVDRKEPNAGYEKGNLALCCYWCNNAKTDEFSKEEFIPIGEAIGLVFQARLKG